MMMNCQWCQQLPLFGQAGHSTWLFGDLCCSRTAVCSPWLDPWQGIEQSQED